jgi:biotin carboxyl carrier protein
MKSQPFLLHVNQHHEVSVYPDDALALDMLPDGEGRFHLLHQGKAWQVEVLHHDYPNNTITLRINGRKQVVTIADHYDRLVRQLGLHASGGHKINSIKAPMPGLVLEVLVADGQEVHKGDSLLILEAMKMENVIKAAGDGKVKSIKAVKGQAVEKGFLLIELE